MTTSLQSAAPTKTDLLSVSDRQASSPDASAAHDAFQHEALSSMASLPKFSPKNALAAKTSSQSVLGDFVQSADKAEASLLNPKEDLTIRSSLADVATPQKAENKTDNATNSMTIQDGATYLVLHDPYSEAAKAAADKKIG